MRSAVFLALAIGASCLVNPLLASTTCQPDTVDFTASGTFDDSATLSGNLDIDIGCGLVTGGDLSIVGSDTSTPVTGGVGSGSETFTDLVNAGAFSANATWVGVQFDSTDDDYVLSLSIDLSAQTNTSSLVGYAGGNLCSTSLTSACTFESELGPAQYVSSYGPTDPNLTSGTLSAGTPEPSSFLLMAAPILCLGIRRMRRRSAVSPL